VPVVILYRNAFIFYGGFFMAKGMRGGFGGGSKKGGAGNMQKMLQQAQRIQAQLQQEMEVLSEETFEITSGGGAVKVFISGDKVIQDIEIMPEIVDPEDIEMLQDTIVAAVNEALSLVDEKQREIQEAYTGGLM
jgi:DNA-binding YbaB/EbfC family protein